MCGEKEIVCGVSWDTKTPRDRKTETGQNKQTAVGTKLKMHLGQIFQLDRSDIPSDDVN